ncbi:MAG: RnfH family protein [Arenimonas sp.]|nr:RnfH family protein [Arenimonas sp.]
MAETIQVTVVYALAHRCWTTVVALPAGSCVADALASADMAASVPGLVVDSEGLAIFGQPAGRRTPLHDGDRVEILRPLVADPKQARRERARVAKKP